MPGGEQWGGVGMVVIRYNKANIPSQHVQHGKPAAQILHCPSEFCKFHLFMDLGMSYMLR